MHKHYFTLLLFLLVAPLLHAQEYFVRATSPEQLVGNVEYLLVHESGNKVYVATPEIYSKSKVKGLKSATFDLEDGRIAITPDDKVLRINLKYSSIKGGRIGLQLFTTDPNTQERTLLRENSNTNLILSNDSTTSTVLYAYKQYAETEEYYLARPGLSVSAYNRIVYNKKIRAFVSSNRKLSHTAEEISFAYLYVKEQAPVAFSSRENDQKAILFSSHYEKTFSPTEEAPYVGSELTEKHGTALVGLRKDVTIFHQKETADGLYLQSEQGKYFSVDTEGTLVLAAEQTEAALWTKVKEDNKVYLQHKATQKYLLYNDDEGFYLAATAHHEREKVALYFTAPTLSLQMQPVGYATFYTNQFSYILPKGLKASSAVLTMENSLDFPYEYNEGDVVPQGTPLLIKSLQEEDHLEGLHTLAFTETRGTPANTYNALRGLEEAGMIPEEAGDYRYFKLTTYQENAQADLHFGFFWGEPNGGTFEIHSNNRAYLVLPPTAALTKGFTLDGHRITHVHSLTTTGREKGVYYDLMGRAYQNRQKGIQVYNTKKMLF